MVDFERENAALKQKSQQKYWKKPPQALHPEQDAEYLSASHGPISTSVKMVNIACPQYFNEVTVIITNDQNTLIL